MLRPRFREDAIIARIRNRWSGAGYRIAGHNIGVAGEFDSNIKSVHGVVRDSIVVTYADPDISGRCSCIAFRKRIVSDGIVITIEKDSPGSAEAGGSHAVITEDAAVDGSVDREHTADSALADLNIGRTGNRDAAGTATEVAFAAQRDIGNRDVAVLSDRHPAATGQASATVDGHIGNSVGYRERVADRSDIELGSVKADPIGADGEGGILTAAKIAGQNVATALYIEHLATLSNRERNGNRQRRRQ